MRAVIYARYSTDLQTEKSVEDQIALCRSYADRHALEVVHVYDDRAISGASTVQRLGWRSLMAAAGERRFDVVISEDVDRIARDEADYHAARKRLTFLGIAIHTAHTGPISGIEGSVRAMMSAYFLENLAHKVRRGLAGVIRSGRHAGGRAYGYRPVQGRPGVLEIVADEAAVVRRIFALYAEGNSPRDIAGTLNREEVPPPRGSHWNASTINGSRQRGSGILNNELYRGRLVWNRLRMIKDPDTGRRVSRLNPESEWQTVDVPHLAIVDDALAAHSDARRQVRSEHRTQRTRPRHLLSGMLRCGVCGSGMTVHDRDRNGRTRIRCSRHRESGSCAHVRLYYLDQVEATVLEGLRRELQDPRLIREFIDTYEAERKSLAIATDTGRARVEQKLGETRRAIMRLVDAIAYGHSAAAEVGPRLEALGAERKRLEDALAAAGRPAPAIVLHPKAVEKYLSQVDEMAKSIRTADKLASGDVAETFRQLVASVTVHPVPARSPLDIEVTGRLGALIEAPPLVSARRSVWGGGGSGGASWPRTTPATFNLRLHSPRIASTKARRRAVNG